ncbi:MAG: GAF domain-containing protein, partial [Firmicutes bacterium]|nr:GAF domain-containing protein [Bacillota bacterium]
MYLADYTKILSSLSIPCLIFKDSRISFANKKFIEITGYSERELKEIPPNQFIHPEDRSYVRNNITKCYSGIEINQDIEFRAFNKAGETVYVLGHCDRIELAGAPAILILCINIRRKVLTRELETSGALAGLSARLLLTESFDEISRLVLDEAKRLTGSKSGFVGYLDEVTRHAILITPGYEVWDNCQIEDRIYVFDKFTGLWGWVLNNKKPILTNSPAEDPRYNGTPPGHITIERFLAVPAMIGTRLVGEVALANPDRDYTRTDQEVVEKLSNIYAIAIQRKWLNEGLKRSERDSRALLEIMSQGVLFQDEQGVITCANPAAQRILGVSQKQIKDKTDFIIILRATREDGTDLPVAEYPSMVALRTGKEVNN